jgi:hypothetical protein
MSLLCKCIRGDYYKKKHFNGFTLKGKCCNTWSWFMNSSENFVRESMRNGAVNYKSFI